MIAYLNSEVRYGLINIVLHWATAVMVIALFVLGVWMVDLDYYSEWYRLGPDLHRSFGVMLALIVVIRLMLRLLNPPPRPLPANYAWEHAVATAIHCLLFMLVLAVAIAGYLMSTADGRSVDVFGWFNVPATIVFFDDQEEIFGDLHWYLALALILVAGLHAAAALGHHYVRKDDTMRRMLGARNP